MATAAAMLCCLAMVLIRTYRSGSICSMTVLEVAALGVRVMAMIDGCSTRAPYSVFQDWVASQINLLRWC